MSGFTQIDSGRDLLNYLEEKGLYIEHSYALASWMNCIFLSDKTSFNWKSKNRQVRVNCTDDLKDRIESKLGIQALDNSTSDRTRGWSFLLDNTEDLDKVIDIIKTMLEK